MKKSQAIKLGVIGFGNMAEAIVSRLLQAKIVTAKNITSVKFEKKRDDYIKKTYRVQLCNTVEELCSRCDVILLAVKPQHLKAVMKDLTPAFRNQLLITVIAGVRLAHYQKNLSKNARIIRVMPNTPAFIGLGMSAYLANKNCKKADIKICESFFHSVGKVVKISREPLMDVVTAVSGSGPAFVYQFALGLMQAAQKLGLPHKTAKELVLQTLKGATEMMATSKDSPEELTKKVTSKKGTTWAGLTTLKKKGFAKTLEACIKQATKRSIELSRLF